MTHEPTIDPTVRHLRVVPNQPTTPETEAPEVVESQDQETTSTSNTTQAPEAQGRVVSAAETETAVSPQRALLQDINARIVAAAGSWHTYALLACHKRYQVIEAYVQDPDLYREICEAEQAEIRRDRAAIAKKLDKAKIRRDASQVKILSEELDALERRELSPMKMDALTLKARGGRLAKQLAMPAAVLFGPLAAGITMGAWWALLAYPIAWGWLAAQGHAMAVADGTVTATEVPHQAPELAVQGQAGIDQRPASVVVGATEDESRLLATMADWQSRWAGRGLEGVTPGTPTVDALGIRVVLTLEGKHTPESMDKKMPALRAALSVPREVKSDLSPGEVGDEVILRIRTRTPDRDMRWRPGCKGIGLDMDTGQPVMLPKGRMLYAGTSGAGKSVMVRVAMAEALTSDEPTVVVYIDPKGEESALWRGKIRIATTPEDIEQTLIDLAKESEVRSEIMQRQGVANWVPTPDRPRIAVFVDEGAELLDMHDVSAKNPEDRIDLLSPLGPLGRLGRSRAIDLKWGTQKPTVGEGLPSQLKGVMQDRIVLKTADRGENNHVLGRAWKTHELELGGFAVTNTGGRGPSQAPIRVWDLSDDSAVASVPGCRVWEHIPLRADEGEGQEELDHDDQDNEDGGDLPEVLAAALMLSDGLDGVPGNEIAAAVGMDLLEVQNQLREAGVKAGRFTNEEGVQVRGYRREYLEDAAARYSR